MFNEFQFNNGQFNGGGGNIVASTPVDLEVLTPATLRAQSRAVITDIGRNVVRRFDVAPVPNGVEEVQSRLKIDYSIFSGGANRAIFTPTGADYSSLSFNIQVQYMELDTYKFIRQIFMGRAAFLFSPDNSANTYKCVFAGGNSLDLKKGPGIDSFYSGRIQMLVVEKV